MNWVDWVNIAIMVVAGSMLLLILLGWFLEKRDGCNRRKVERLEYMSERDERRAKYEHYEAKRREFEETINAMRREKERRQGSTHVHWGEYGTDRWTGATTQWAKNTPMIGGGGGGSVTNMNVGGAGGWEINWGSGEYNWEYPPKISIDPKVIDEASESLRKAGASAQSVQEAFERLAMAGVSQGEKARKEITEVQFSQMNHPVETLDGNFVAGITGEYTIADQDGESLPRPLEEKLRRTIDRADTNNLSVQDISDILAWWNEGEVVTGTHINRCPYPKHPSKWACICQPPTIFGSVERYQCTCCSEPYALEKFGLCDVCERHEYASSDIVAMEHEDL